MDPRYRFEIRGDSCSPEKGTLVLKAMNPKSYSVAKAAFQFQSLLSTDWKSNLEKQLPELLVNSTRSPPRITSTVCLA